MLKDIAKIFSSHIIVKILGLISIVIVLKFLSIEEFGEYSYYLVLLNLAAIIIDPFLSAYLVDYRTKNYTKNNFGVFSFPIVLLPLFYIYTLFFIPNIDTIIFTLFCSTFFLSAGLKSYLNVRERYFDYGLVDVLRQFSLFFTTIIFFLILNQKEYLELLKLNYLASTITMIVLFTVMMKKQEISFNLRFLKLKKIVFESKFLIFFTTIILLVTFIDSYFVELYLTKQDLGLYSFSLKIYTISLMLVVPIFTVLNLKQIEIAKEKGYYSFLKSNFKNVLGFSTVIFLLALLANWIITDFIFTEYRESFWSTTILLCGSFITYVSLPFSFLIAYRKYKHLFLLGMLAISLNILINYFFINKYGILIAAFATFLSQLIINLGASILSYMILHKREYES